MKKIFLMLSLSIFALSCENEDTDNMYLLKQKFLENGNCISSKNKI